LRRELVHLMETANQRPVQPRLGQQTIAQYRRGKKLSDVVAVIRLTMSRRLAPNIGPAGRVTVALSVQNHPSGARQQNADVFGQILTRTY
jgi:hypothetical protein